MWWNWPWWLRWLKPVKQTWVSTLTSSLLYTVCRLWLRESNSKWTQGQRSRKLPCNEALVMHPPTQGKYDKDCMIFLIVLKRITVIVWPTCIANCGVFICIDANNEHLIYKLINWLFRCIVHSIHIDVSLYIYFIIHVT